MGTLLSQLMVSHLITSGRPSINVAEFVLEIGVQSRARGLILGHDLPPIDTGDFSYRILIPGSVLLDDPELRDLISQPWVSSWCGPDAHVIGYPVRGGEIYNVVCCCAGRSMQDRPLAANETKAVVDNNTELVRRFQDWEPRVRKIVGYAKKVCLVIYPCLREY